MVIRMNNRELRKFVNSEPNDSKRHDALHDATKRIRQLERLNAALAAEIDRMRPVVEAAIDMQEHGCGQCEAKLDEAVITYKASEPK